MGSSAVEKGLRKTFMSSNVNILLVVLDRDLYDKISPLLHRDTFEVNQAPNAESALLLTGNMAYNLIVVVHPLRGTTIEDFLRRLRRRDSASADAPVLILAAEERIENLRPLAEIGRVSLVSSSQPQTDLQGEVSRLLGVAARTAKRLLVNLQVKLGDGAADRICQTQNISESGLLIRTSHLLPIGTTIDVEIPLPESDAPLALRAEIVRHTTPNMEQITGMGAKFIGITPEEQQLLRSYIWEGLKETV